MTISDTILTSVVTVSGATPTVTPVVSIVTVTMGGGDSGDQVTTLTMTVANPVSSPPAASTITQTVGGGVVTETVTSVVTATMISVSTVDAPGTCVCTTIAADAAEPPKKYHGLKSYVAAEADTIGHNANGKYKLRRSALY
ncbi:hypothetical protein F4782DRAFT_288398 [Xylaria castorea]|nr:hypothetical protein F4782DRAFT_288398 [Xylaria castorea]